MTNISSDIDRALATRLKTERHTRNWSMQELANRAGISKAMIGRIEKGDVSATANILAKLANALGLTLSMLLARTEADQGDHLSRDQQPVWVDPETGYIRRSISAAGVRGAEVTEVTLPGKAEVRLDVQTHAITAQQLLMLEGALIFECGHKAFRLARGDWLRTPDSGPRVFRNPQSKPCVYLLISV